MLTVDLLGPLRVTVAGQPVDLPAGHVRTLLAALAMSAGHPVATERLATAVWGTDPRGDLRTNIRTNIKRDRKSVV